MGVCVVVPLDGRQVGMEGQEDRSHETLLNSTISVVGAACSPPGCPTDREARPGNQAHQRSGESGRRLGSGSRGGGPCPRGTAQCCRVGDGGKAGAAAGEGGCLPETGRGVAVSPCIPQLDPLGLLVVVLAPAVRVLPDVAPLRHVRHGEVGGYLVSAHCGRSALVVAFYEIVIKKEKIR